MLTSKRFDLVRLFIFWVLLFSLIIGFLMFLELQWMTPVFLLLSYPTLLIVLVVNARLWHDWLNPLTLILFLGFVRFSLPGLLLLGGIEPDLPIFEVMCLTPKHWLLGHALGMIGVIGVAIGWLIPTRFLQKALRQILVSLKVRLSGGGFHAAILGMLIGFISLLVFIGSNAPIAEAIWAGTFRGTEIREGTGKYFYLGLLSIAASVVLSGYLANKRHPWWIVLLPVAVVAIQFWSLGGRVRSLTPLVARSVTPVVSAK